MSNVMKRRLPLMVTAIFGISMILSYFFSKSIPALNTISNELMTWGKIMSAFALFLGATTMTVSHIRKVQGKDPKERFLSSWLIILIIVFSVAGILFEPTVGSYALWYNVVAMGIGISTESLLAFYIMVAAYRAFRFKTVESSLLMISCFITMFWSAPVGAAIWPGITELGNWLMNVPNKATTRGIILGIAVGTISLGIRMIMGKETAYLGGEE